MFLHYVCDIWMKRNFPLAPFERYADDGVVHCQTREEAEIIKESLAERFKDCKLEMHPDKTRIVYCKDKDRKQEAPLQSLISLDIHSRVYILNVGMGNFDVTL